MILNNKVSIIDFFKSAKHFDNKKSLKSLCYTVTVHMYSKNDTSTIKLMIKIYCKHRELTLNVCFFVGQLLP